MAMSGAASPGETEPQPLPYPPSFVDRITDRVERGRLPWWLTYMLAALVLDALVAFILWRAGVYARVGFHPMQVWLPTLAVYLFALMHGLDRAAGAALERFRPAFGGDEAEFAAARYRLTTLPARPTLIFTLAATLLTTPLGRYEMAMVQTGGFELVPALFLSVLAALYVITYPFLYHTWHQLREIHRLHRDWAEVDLGNVRPMHALARVTSLTALGLLINNYGWFLAQPGGDLSNPVLLGEGVFNLLITAIVFGWPLWGAHRKLAEAREGALLQVAVRKRAVRGQLHAAVDAGRLGEIDPLNKVLGALQAEQAELQGTATWPWAPATLRSLAGAVLLPVVLWLMQYGLGRLLG